VDGAAAGSSKGKAPLKRKSGSTVAGRSKGKSASTVKATRKEPAAAEERRVLISESSGSEEWESEEEEPLRMAGSMPVVPRTSHVDEGARRKIRKGEFVDFKSLIPRARVDRPRRRLELVDGVLEEFEDTSNLQFYKWIDAFVVFMSVRLEFFPTESQGLLRHLQIVKKMHGNGKDGVEYDYQFRRMQSQHRDIRWGEYLSELAVEVSQAGQSGGAEKERPRPPIPSRPLPLADRGRSVMHCFKFNDQVGCGYGSRCRFAHKCKKCASSDHPAFRCNKK
jgi:hypothetical protein